MKILIAEDDNVSRLVLASTLKKQGHEVFAAENGLKAWEAFQKDDFPVLILDWLMPEMDGLALCRRVRALQRENYTYVVLLTSLEGKANYLEAMEVGADDFMTKPFDAEQLTCRIHVAERIIGLQRRIAEAARGLREKNEQMEEELKMAHELQMALLPQQFPSIPRGEPPTESEIKFSSFYYPMAAVSGDFFTSQSSFRHRCSRFHCRCNGPRRSRRINYRHAERTCRKIQRFGCRSGRDAYEY